MTIGPAAEAPTASEYIVHHLTQLTNTGVRQTHIIDFSLINIDTMVFSLAMGLVALLIMMLVARRATSGVPGRLQAAV